MSKKRLAERIESAHSAIGIRDTVNWTSRDTYSSVAKSAICSYYVKSNKYMGKLIVDDYQSNTLLQRRHEAIYNNWQ